MGRSYSLRAPVEIENLEPPEREDSGIKCNCCGYDLDPGEEYGQLGIVRICENCMTNASNGEIFDLLGGSWKRVDDEG